MKITSTLLCVIKRSYKLMHKNARLTEEDKKMLLEWVEKTRDSIN